MERWRARTTREGEAQKARTLADSSGGANRLLPKPVRPISQAHLGNRTHRTLEDQ